MSFRLRARTARTPDALSLGGATRARQGRGFAIGQRRLLGFESLEARALLAALAAVPPAAIIGPPDDSILASPPDDGDAFSAATSTPTGLTPSQLRNAYGFNNISFGSIVGDGTGQTIAIVVAFNNPNIASDLHAFDQQFSLPDPPSFSILAESGTTNAPLGNWGIEAALDVQWAHALAPGASILLVEAKSTGIDLYLEAQLAAQQPNVSVVSMSWGSAEFSGETGRDQYFTQPAAHAGVTFLASTGDSAKPGMFPAYSPNVLAVGGTAFSPALGSQGTYTGEIGWSSGGGGISVYEAQPSYQAAFVTQSASARTIPDVAFDASSGASVYDSYDNSATTPWMSKGGTSLSSPCWGALMAIVDQGRSLAGQPAFDTLTAASGLYHLASTAYSSSFHDITSGSNGFSASIGYDLVTGLGTPIASAIAAGLNTYWLPHTPSVTGATTLNNAQTTSGLVIAPYPLDVGEVTSYQITGINGGTLYQADGATPISNGNFISVAQGAAGLKFTPGSSSVDTGSFFVRASLTADTTGLGGALALATITPTVHAPTVSSTETLQNTQTSSGLVITANPLDAGVVMSYQISGITGGTLYQANGATPINNGDFITLAQGAAGLKFTPTTDSLDTGSFTVQSSITGNSSGLGGSVVTATVAVALLGDIDGDGVVDNFDISSFELALTNPAAFLAQNPARTDYVLRGDINGDGLFNNFDIAPFESLLAASDAAAAHSAAANQTTDARSVVADLAGTSPPTVAANMIRANSGLNVVSTLSISPTAIAQTQGVTIGPGIGDCMQQSAVWPILPRNAQIGG